jgi:hypothetical protein
LRLAGLRRVTFRAVLRFAGLRRVAFRALLRLAGFRFADFRRATFDFAGFRALRPAGFLALRFADFRVFRWPAVPRVLAMLYPTSVSSLMW